MARSFKFTATLALSLLLAPSFVCAMDVGTENAKLKESLVKQLTPLLAADARAELDAKTLLELTEMANAKQAELNARLDAQATAKKQAADQAAAAKQQEAQAAAAVKQQATDAAAATAADRAKKFNETLRFNGWSPARAVCASTGTDGEAEYSTKWIAIDLAVVATAVTAAYFGTDAGQSSIRWILSFAPDAVISEERKLQWTVEKEQIAAKNAEVAKARATKVAQLKAQSEELVARRLAAVQA